MPETETQLLLGGQVQEIRPEGQDKSILRQIRKLGAATVRIPSSRRASEGGQLECGRSPFLSASRAETMLEDCSQDQLKHNKILAQHLN